MDEKEINKLIEENQLLDKIYEENNKEELDEEDLENYDSGDGITDVRLYPISHNFAFSHSLLSCIMGPVGSGKSTASLAKLFLYACCIKKGKGGIRRSKMVIIRNTYKQLKQTTLSTFFQWFGNLGTFKVSDMMFEMRFNDVECDILFLALDTEKDREKLLSLECTCMYFNELREINEKVFLTSIQRIGRYPSKKANGTGALFDLERAKEFGLDLDYTKKNIECKAIFSDTNPPNMDSFFYKVFERKLFDSEGRDCNLRDFKLFKQPSGLDPLAENKRWLDNDYYDNIVNNSPKDEVDVMVHVKYGLGGDGLAVYREEFDRDRNVKEDLFNIMYTGSKKLFIGADYGLNPSVVIGQYIDGTLYIYDEVITLNKNKRSMKEMIQSDLIPLIKRKYKKHQLNGDDIFVVGDPAGEGRSQGDGKVFSQEFKERGFKIHNFQKDDMNNRISPRIQSVKDLLITNYQLRVSKLMIDSKCQFLISGLGGNYYYEKNKSDFNDKPCKNEYSHIQDALQYACLHIHKYKGKFIDKKASSQYYQQNTPYQYGDKYTGY